MARGCLVLLVLMAAGVLGDVSNNGGSPASAAKRCPLGLTSGCCSEKEFTCKDNSCIPSDRVCDLKNDCPDRSDEKYCINGSCINHSCTQVCNEYHNFHYCSCLKGFLRLGELSTYCVDNNECEDPTNKCSQICQNTKGSYNCQCVDGYSMSASHKGRCVKNERTIYLLFAKDKEISGINIDTGEKTLIAEAYEEVTSFDFDQGDMVYWVQEHSTVWRSYVARLLRGVVTSGVPQRTHIALFSNHKITSIAVDWMAGNMYLSVSQGRNGYILVSKVDGRYQKTIVERLNHPRSLILSPGVGRMYFLTDNSVLGGNVLNSVSMDGSHSLLRKAGNITAFFIDQLANDRIYLSNDNSLISFTFESPYVPKEYTLLDNFTAVSAEIFEENIYWITNERKHIYRFSKFSNNVTIFYDHSIFPEEISAMRVFHAHRLPNHRSIMDQCIDGTCPFLCLHNTQGFNCSCPDYGCSSSQEPVLKLPLICSCPNRGRCYPGTDLCIDWTEQIDHTEKKYLAYGLCVVFVVVLTSLVLSCFKRGQ